jgi:hypothetical protein
MAPFGVVRVTVRVWPTGNASGWVVGQSPVAEDPPGAAEAPALADAPAPAEAPAAVDAPGDAEGVAALPPSFGRNTRMSAITATTATAPPSSQAAPGRLVDVVAPRTGVRPVGGRLLDPCDGCRCEPRRRFPFDESGTVPPDRVRHAAADTAAG